jgi:hypothetical protein
MTWVCKCNRLRQPERWRAIIGKHMDRKFSVGFITRNAFWGLLAICCVIIVIGATVPLSQPRIPVNHWRAANSSAQLIAAEWRYATRFPATGFTCDLRQLAQAGLVDTVLASGDKAGYQYELHGCNTSGTASVFSFSAVPIAQDRTGKFAFCANQEGMLWYAGDGSTDECFRSRARWTRSTDGWR